MKNFDDEKEFYKLKYKFSADDNNGKGYSKKQIEEEQKIDEDIGACDGCIFVSIIKNETGEFSMLPFSYKATELDIFKTWAMMSETLSKCSSLQDWHRAIAYEAFEKTKACMETIAKQK